MRIAGAVFGVCLVSVVGSAAARADTGPSPLSRITVLGDVGYAYPAGTAETGTDTRDVSFGLVPLSLVGTYDLARSWSASARLRYAFNIPTLCASAADCESSLGREVAVTVGIGRLLPRWWHLTPCVGFESGWEWLTAKLSDAGVAASRGWNGAFARLEISADLKSSGPWSLGPALGVEAGLFTHFDLDTPAGHSSGGTERAVHAWPTISLRLGRRL
jgi:hypothetical protein